MCGWSVFVCSNALASFCATSPDVYASMESSSDIGRLSVSDPGFGIGMHCVCLACSGRIL